MAQRAYEAFRWPKQMRVKIVGPLSENLPTIIRLNLDYYHGLAKTHGLTNVKIQVDMLPKSLNHMYGRNGDRTFKVQQVRDFIDRMILAYREQHFDWQPIGACAAIILLESPLWVGKTRQIRQMDADNKVKVVMDSTEDATGVFDERYWQFHVFKVASKRTRTTACLFDLGDIIEYFY